MSRTLFGFYDLDAGPQHGLPGELAARLGAALETEGFVDGALYVRSDNAAIAIQVQHAESEGWERRGPVSVLLQAADWRSRERDLRSYRLAGQVRGDGNPLKDSTFFIVQRFRVKPEVQDNFVRAICRYTESFAMPIPGFLGGDAFASLDRTEVVFVMPWAHEAALNSLENREGSLMAMQEHLGLCESHVYASYQRVSYLEAPAGSGQSGTVVSISRKAAS